jgi:hypothetical protein
MNASQGNYPRVEAGDPEADAEHPAANGLVQDRGLCLRLFCQRPVETLIKIHSSARNRPETNSAQHLSHCRTMEFSQMLAEKFILMLEALIRSQARAPRVFTSSPHVPVKLPTGSARSLDERPSE